MNEHIWIIAPFKELYDLAEECKHERNLDITIKQGNFEEGIPFAKEAEKRGADVLISRGGTASILRKHVEIPVINIKVTCVDILRVMYPYRDDNHTVLAVGYSSVVDGCQRIGKLLSIKVKEVRVPEEGDESRWQIMQQEVKKILSETAITTIIADTGSKKRLQDLSQNIELITSDKESISEAIDEALNIVAARNQEKENTKTFQAVLDFISDGVIAVDEKGIVTVFNHSAEKTFKVTKETIIGRHINDIIDEEGTSRVLRTSQAELDQIQKVPHGRIMINQIPINVGGQIKGVVSTFQDISKIQGAEQKIRTSLYARGFATRYTFSDILTKNKRMLKIIEVAKDYSKTNATILIEGESGTGKELFAQSIHAESERRDAPFVAINCAALPPNLLESELFGYVEGAFTGAAKGGKMGLFEVAHKGTIFLDEIGSMNTDLQAKLLRILEERQVMRLGSDKVIPVNIRVIAATNTSLKQQVSEGTFRSDFFYRLNVLNLHTIPLRERRDDIEYLILYFVRSISRKYGLQVEKFSPDLMEFMIRYSWPGNVREMKNVIERIVVTSRKDYITLSDVELIIEEFNESAFSSGSVEIPRELLNTPLEEIKERIIMQVLAEEGYNKSKAAKRLGIDRSTLNRIIQ
jgi:PAS domain S-box-containing protein